MALAGSSDASETRSFVPLSEQVCAVIKWASKSPFAHLNQSKWELQILNAPDLALSKITFLEDNAIMSIYNRNFVTAPNFSHCHRLLSPTQCLDRPGTLPLSFWAFAHGILVWFLAITITAHTIIHHHRSSFHHHFKASTFKVKWLHQAFHPLRAFGVNLSTLSFWICQLVLLQASLKWGNQSWASLLSLTLVEAKSGDPLSTFVEEDSGHLGRSL